MIGIPAIILSAVTLFYIWRYKFNIASFILLLYSLSFATSIPLYYVYKAYPQIEVSAGSMIYLVTMLLIWLLPVLIFSTKKSAFEQEAPLGKFLFISLILIMSSVLTYAAILPAGIQNILRGDIQWIRNTSMLRPVQIYSANRILDFIISNVIAFYPVCLFFFFYSISFLNLKNYFNKLLLFSSTSGLVASLLYVARSEIVYWSLMYIFLYIFFRKYLNSSQRSKILLPFISLFIVGIFYFSFISEARFGRSDEGTLLSLLRYSGQHVINFGVIFDKFDDFQNGTLNFPYFQDILGFEHREGVVDYFQRIEDKTGFNIGVFYTFIGSLFIDFGPYVTTFIIILISVSGFLLFRITEKIPFYRIFLIILYCQIPLQGIFIFNLLNNNGNKYIILMVALSIFFKYKVSYKKKPTPQLYPLKKSYLNRKRMAN